jgi:hypothetical protein
MISAEIHAFLSLDRFENQDREERSWCRTSAVPVCRSWATMVTPPAGAKMLRVSAQVTIMFQKTPYRLPAHIKWPSPSIDGLGKSMKPIRPTGRPKAMEATVIR